MGAITTGLKRSGASLEVRGANPTKPFGDTTPPTNGSLGGSIAGTSITERSAQAISSVSTAVAIISDAISTLPLREYVVKNGQMVECDPSPVIAQPWAEVSPIDFMDQVVRSMALRGNAYGRIAQRDGRGYPLQVILAAPDTVQVGRDPKTNAKVVKINNQVIDPDDVFHIPYHMSPGSLIGFNPIDVHRITFGLARASDLMASNFFSNSARPDGILKITGDMDEEELEMMLQKWNSHHQGIGNSSGVAALTGDVDWQPISVSPKDAQFLESRQYSRSDIFSIFRIPPHMTGEVDKTTSWGTALKPAFEPVVVARKPLIGTVANNVLTYGTGALNIDGSRVEHTGDNQGRWPANVIHDGSDEVLAGFPDSKSQKGTSTANRSGFFAPETKHGGSRTFERYGDLGSAARFFYCAKASRSERNAGLEELPQQTGGEATGRVDGSAGLSSPRAGAGRTGGSANLHPTVKPLALMRYLVKLVTPPNGIVLDPFLGSGTTAVAAILEGFDWIGCEMTEEYFPLIEARTEWAANQQKTLF